jgi:3-phenylpropionate/trans-cinnamate dioxygenase ferredoxin reductase component
MPTSETYVIAGASLAGAKAAETLRAEGFDGRVILVGDESVRPYERPPLSKAYLRGEVDFDTAAVHDESFYGANEIELLTSTTVADIDPTSRTVTLDPGGTLPYDQLLLTTGASPRRLNIPGSDLPGIHYLRSLESCDTLRQALASGSRAVVIGAGWIGSEVAASARQMGKEVALVEVASVPLERVLGTEIGAVFRDLHADHGVELHFGTGVDGFRGDKRVEAVVLSDGSELSGDVFVVGVGVHPRTELARGTAIHLDNGVVVDEYLATSVAGIWAAGDVANAWHPTLSTRIRLEHWSAALNQGPVAAKNMLGRATPYTKIPYFFSDQYDLGMEYNGLAVHWDQIVYRGDRDKREFIAFWLESGRVLAGMNVNVWDVAEEIADLVASKRTVDPKALADPGVELGSLAHA